VKYWDGLAAVRTILDTTRRGDRILDAGAERYSPILPWLAHYGYWRLLGCNLSFEAPWRVGPIRYENADITATPYRRDEFAGITCMSVIEHGVDLERFVAEMARILRCGGALIVSTDYWPEPIDTSAVRKYDASYRIFSRDDILGLVATAETRGLRLTAPVALEAEERPISYEGHHFTFAMLTFVNAR
jgi:SAM-dependent methyltransferase